MQGPTYASHAHAPEHTHDTRAQNTQNTYTRRCGVWRAAMHSPLTHPRALLSAAQQPLSYLSLSQRSDAFIQSRANLTSLESILLITAASAARPASTLAYALLCARGAHRPSCPRSPHRPIKTTTTRESEPVRPSLRHTTVRKSALSLLNQPRAGTAAKASCPFAKASRPFKFSRGRTRAAAPAMRDQNAMETRGSLKVKGPRRH